MNKTCVIVSPYFPPSSLAGVHRARHLAKHLPAFGWTPIVLCVDEAYHEELLDPGLASLVPSTVEIVKVPALSARLTRSFGVGEISLRAWRPLRGRLIRLLEQQSVDAVLITGSPYFPMLLADEVKRRFRVPVVLDFQDPWVSAWGATQSRWSKSGLSHSLATLLEPRVLRAASFVTSVSETQNAQLAARYPWLNGERMTAIPIGADPEDFLALRNMPPSDRGLEFDDDRINLSYVGTFWPRAEAVMQALLRGVARLRESQPALAKRLMLYFVGTSNQPNEFKLFGVLPLAERIGVMDMVREIPQRIPYLDALSVLARSDGILMIGSDEPHYTASKIYPGLMSGRPFLSIFHHASGAHEILSAAGGGVPLSFSNAKELDTLERPICNGLVRLVEEPETLGQAVRTAYAPYEASNIARQFATIFDGLSRDGV